MIPLVTSSLLFSAGGLFMKPAAGFTRAWPSAAVLVCFMIGAVFLAIAVNRGDLSRTYVIGLGIEAVVSVAVGLLLLNERLSVQQGVGVLLIVAGLACMRS
jgi:small multidrug resistance pump